IPRSARRRRRRTDCRRGPHGPLPGSTAGPWRRTTPRSRRRATPERARARLTAKVAEYQAEARADRVSLFPPTRRGHPLFAGMSKRRESAEIEGVRVRSGIVTGLVLGMALLAFALGILARRADGPLELMALASDGMVLQRDTMVSITGRARPGWPVVLVGTWGGVTVTHADATGAWQASLHTRGAGGPYRMLVWAGGVRVVHDVWLGETWLCSGQSNMAIPIAEDDPRVTLDVPASPPIQLFTVPLAAADTPQAGCRGAWTTARRETAREFSAVCWHFGRALRATLGVPIGLVAAAASGVDIIGWTSQRTLASFPDDLLAYQNASYEPEPVSTILTPRPSLFFNAMIAPLA